MDFPEDTVEFQRCWSSAAGALGAMAECLAEIESRSAAAFVARRDDVATSLRDLAQEIKIRKEKLSLKLTLFINEDNKRSYEKRKAYGL